MTIVQVGSKYWSVLREGLLWLGIFRGLSGVNQCRIHSYPSLINYFPPAINFLLSGYSSPDIWQYFGESYVCLTVNRIVGILVISDPNNADPRINKCFTYPKKPQHDSWRHGVYWCLFLGLSSCQSFKLCSKQLELVFNKKHFKSFRGQIPTLHSNLWWRFTELSRFVVPSASGVAYDALVQRRFL